jgi:hypothetical protein
MHRDPEHETARDRRYSVTRTTNVVINNSTTSGDGRRCCS